MGIKGKTLTVFFFKSSSEEEPVRDFLKELSENDRKTVGEDLKTVEQGWPLGMPLVRKMEPGLWEVRCTVSGGRTLRILFTIADSCMVLLHIFFKKSAKTPERELKTARERAKQVLGRCRDERQ
jgi:phage-related protein